MASQRITTSDVRDRINDLNRIIEKNYNMGNSATTGINSMNSGITQNMQYNMSGKALSVARSLRSILQLLNQGKDILEQVVLAYEGTDSNLKKKVEDWVGDTEVMSVGKPLATNNSENKNMGQCVGYVYARMKHLYPELKLNSGDAVNWLKNNSNNDAVSVIEGGWENISKLKVPCVAMTQGISSYKHVIVIEDIRYNADGTIKEIYFSESNKDGNGVWNEGTDGILQKLSFEDFTAKKYLKVEGFVVPK